MREQILSIIEKKNEIKRRRKSTKIEKEREKKEK